MLLVDAYSQIFRAYYAMTPLSNERGEPVNALYGFTRLLCQLERDYPTNCGAIVFDCGRVSFRMTLNPEYKANRKPMPEDLKQQVPFIREMAQAFGWPLLEEPEYEADDLIGALAVHCSEPVEIISSDKDLSQLISERIIQLIPGKKGGFDRRGVAEVREKFGVGPERIVDYLSLLGDAADNIPGAFGIGCKGAAAILNESGALEEILADLNRAAEKYRAKLADSRGILLRNLQLIRLKTDLPERLVLPDCCGKKVPDWPEVRRLCERYGLRSILRDLEKEQNLPAAPGKPEPPPMEQGLLF